MSMQKLKEFFKFLDTHERKNQNALLISKVVSCRIKDNAIEKMNIKLNKINKLTNTK